VVAGGGLVLIGKEKMPAFACARRGSPHRPGPGIVLILGGKREQNKTLAEVICGETTGTVRGSVNGNADARTAVVHSSCLEMA